MNVHRAPSRDPSNEGTFSVRLFGFVFNLKAGVEVFFPGPSRNSEAYIYHLWGIPRLKRPQTPAAMESLCLTVSSKKEPWKACSNPSHSGAHVHLRRASNVEPARRVMLLPAQLLGVYGYMGVCLCPERPRGLQQNTGQESGVGSLAPIAVDL